MVKDIGLSSLQADEESNRNTTPLFSYLTPNSSEEVPKPILCPVINPQKMISLQSQTSGAGETVRYRKYIMQSKLLKIKILMPKCGNLFQKCMEYGYRKGICLIPGKIPFFS